MIRGLPIYVPIVFLLATLTTIWFLIKAAEPAGKVSLPSRLLFFLLPLWMLLTGFLSTTGFYHNPEAIPPRVVAFAVLPAALCIIGYFLFFRDNFVNLLTLKWLTILHVIRIPVEIVLLWLFQAGHVPQIMTFEGRNFDILSGITAPIVYWFAFRNGRTNKPLFIAWNLFALGLLANIVSIAVLSFPSPFQRFGFEQPNIGLTYLPFIWLPAIVVPIVLFAHLVSLYKLIRKSEA